MKTQEEINEQKQNDIQFIVSAVTAELHDLARFKYFQAWEDNGGMGWFFSECVEITHKIMLSEGSPYLKWLEYWKGTEDNNFKSFSEFTNETCFDWYHMIEARKEFESRYVKDEDTMVEISEHIGSIINSFESDAERVKLIEMAIAFANKDRKNENLKLTTSSVEIDIRIECARRCAKYAYDTISKYTEKVDKGEAFVMSVSDHDSIHQNCSDISIALDMNDDMCISDDWYNLFSEFKKPKIETVMDNKLLNVTAQTSVSETADKIVGIIEELKSLDNGNGVDGETMQYILDAIGMSDQMLRQLVMSRDVNETLGLIGEKFEQK